MHVRFNAPARCHLKILPVPEAGVVSTMPALEPSYPSTEFVVSRSRLGYVFRSEGPRLTPVKRGLKVGVQCSDFPDKRDGLPIIQLRAQAFEE